MTVGEETEASRSALVTAELRAALQDSTATVRSPTVLRAILLVWEERHDFLLVSPTGSGQSMSYVIPAGWGRVRCGRSHMRASGQYCYRVREMRPPGGPVPDWDRADDDFAPGVVVFSLEALVSDAGRSLLVALGAMTRLRGIFLDEVHTMREWREFRVGCADPMPLLRNKNLLVPLVGLTATASPELCVELQQAMGTWGTRASGTDRSPKFAARCV
jgi:superfamily II DNA helicase RecQ